GAHYLSHGTLGEAPDLPPVVEVVALLKRWNASTEATERAEIWNSMLSIYTDQVFSIGTVNATLQPVLASSRLPNMPDKPLYGYD
ncbi:ABC transporter substrate-binding protein, partial [Mesorhizobium japonicum]